MSIPSRNSSPPRSIPYHRTFFVTSSTHGKRSLLQSTRAAALLLDVLDHYRKQGKYLLHEFVIMPDHFHVMITVAPNVTIERAVQFIKGGFAFRAGRELGLRAPIWQKGFSETRILDRPAYLRTRTYIHANPVSRGLAANPADYEFSSARSSFALDAPPRWLKGAAENPELNAPAPEGTSRRVACAIAEAIA